jgi:ABC-2 type transport system ATP-binding protein
MTSEFAIETEGLEKVYQPRFGGREIRAVSQVSLRVPRGVKFGLLGANGAGKTTFVKLLLSVIHPTAGSAKIFGRNSQQPEARYPVGYLPENHRFPTYLTGAGMLDFYSALSGLDSEQRKQRIPELLQLVGLHDWANVRIKKYSKGMLQRLGLAQALIHKPQLLVLDEPTDGVDPVGRRDIRDILNRLTDGGVTVFLNSHLLSEVESFCEYVAILTHGQLALEGKMSDLLAGGGYRIVISNVPESAAVQIRAIASSLSVGDTGLEVQARSRDDANRIIDLVRKSDGYVESMAASTSTLEDVFIRITRDSGQAA